MEENQFIEVMKKHSDEKLLEILNVKRKDYVADAITWHDSLSTTYVVDDKKMKQ
ncbi:hypothetical protein [Bacteroides finegoldii]|uniref:hypothetical protein n=1 Tax=Bacteroides finegoldii TaxID=338188 RepID=UPI0018A04E88|nr:hypothetical protein [Bacteroides finegoldii]